MKKTYLSLIGVLCAVLLIAPQNTEAYVTTEQTSLQLAPNIALYTITYEFGPSAYDFYLPTKASRVDSNSTDLQYELRIDGETPTAEGVSAGAILTDAELTSDGYYFIPRGKRESFTLLVLLAVDEAVPEADYALNVIRLPFVEDRGDDIVVENGLSKPELSYYQTAEVELNGDATHFDPLPNLSSNTAAIQIHH